MILFCHVTVCAIPAYQSHAITVTFSKWNLIKCDSSTSLIRSLSRWYYWGKPWDLWCHKSAWVCPLRCLRAFWHMVDSLDYMLCYFSSYKWRKVLIRIQLFVHMKILKAKSYVNRVGMPWKVGHGWKVQQEFFTLLGKITHDSIPDLYCLSLITVSALVVWFYNIQLHGSHKTAHKAFIWNIN